MESRFTGLSTRASDLITVKFKYARLFAICVVNAVRIANLMHIVLHSYHILEIHDTGVRVFGCKLSKYSLAAAKNVCHGPFLQ